MQEPKLVLFSGQVASAWLCICNKRPFCVRVMKSVYRSQLFAELPEQAGSNREILPLLMLLSHEIGHHVQNLLGILDEVNSQRRRLSEVQANQLVRLELADSFQVWAHYADRMLNILEMGDAE